MISKALAAISGLVAIPVRARADHIATGEVECVATGPDGPIVVTPGCIDPDYSEIVIDSGSDETSPIPHRKVSAHFNGTDIAINIYLPPKHQWQGRFFQMVYPSHEADALDVNVSFGADSGGYAVQITGTGGYRADAAAAKFSKTMASEYYGEPDRHIYGYIYGGSGGSLQTVGAIENTKKVWDGAVAIIQAVPVSFMGNPSIRCLAGIGLKDKKAQIAAAVSPGGNGDSFAGLTDLETSVLKEATIMGIPMSSWEVFDSVTNCTTMNLLRGDVEGIDNSYASDFWTKPGYLGTEDSELGRVFQSLKVEHTSTVTAIQKHSDGEVVIFLDSIPADPGQVGLDFTILSANGIDAGQLEGTLSSDKTLTVNATFADSSALEAVNEGAQLRIDNRWFIAMHAYHRYQVPTREGFHGYDQFRNASGKPIFPQRPIDTSETVARSASGGGTHTGNITAQVIVVSNLIDYDAFPWHADWYQSQVKKTLGSQFHDNYRLWFNENADHNFGAVPHKWLHRLVDFTGIYHQALRDLSTWVERGIPAPLSTKYTVSADSQVLIPPSGRSRLGIQPSVSLTVDRPRVSVGDTVAFTAHAEVPERAGKIVAVEYDFMGTGDFVGIAFGNARETVNIQTNFTYQQPRRFVPAVRVTSQREGNTTNPNRRVMNLGRVSVEVLQ
ncbi:hypothetical protein FDECE_17860 [Fusarium decemcellulare]|nr:hypothetical protein FDECE_17860 [Fusarium decemcellulare]